MDESIMSPDDRIDRSEAVKNSRVMLAGELADLVARFPGLNGNGLLVAADELEDIA